MTTYYTDSAGSDTSPYDTWAKAAISIQTVVDLASAADTIFARGSQTLAASIDIDTNNGTAGSLIKVIGANAGGTVDGTQFTLDGDSSATNCIAIAASKGEFWWWENVKFTGATGAGVACANAVSTQKTFVNCSNNLNGGRSWDLYFGTDTGDKINNILVRCSAIGNSGGGGFDSSFYPAYYIGCIAGDNSGPGFYQQFRNTAVYWGCVSYNNSDHGFELDGNGVVINCVADENDGDGVNVGGTGLVVGSRLTDNGKDATGYGLNEIGANHCIYGWNFLIDNDSGATNGTCEALPYDSDTDTNETSGTEGYEDGAARDYNLTSSATLRSTALEID